MNNNGTRIMTQTRSKLAKATTEQCLKPLLGYHCFWVINWYSRRSIVVSENNFRLQTISYENTCSNRTIKTLMHCRQILF